MMSSYEANTNNNSSPLFNLNNLLRLSLDLKGESSIIITTTKSDFLQCIPKRLKYLKLIFDISLTTSEELLDHISKLHQLLSEYVGESGTLTSLHLNSYLPFSAFIDICWANSLLKNTSVIDLIINGAISDTDNYCHKLFSALGIRSTKLDSFKMNNFSI
jgi:hypothetical protein